jgi:hypothetical protein
MNAHDLNGMAADKMSSLGAEVVRLVFGWDVIEPNCKGCFNWTTTDGWRDQAHRTKRVIFATLAYTPQWANGGGPFQNPPISNQDWYDFVFAAASRYKNDIFLWGVWNEPNLSQYLQGGDLPKYEQLVRTAQAAVHAANPAALVLGPEVSHHAMSNGWYAAVMADVGNFFDIVTVHWYPDGPPLESFMDDAVRPSALKKDVWLTETGMTPCQTAFGETGQALFYQQVLQAFEARRSWWTAVLFYDLYDPPAPNSCSSGVLAPDWSARPAFSLLQSFIRAHP